MEMTESFLPVELSLERHRSRFPHELELYVALSGERIDLAFIDVKGSAPGMVLVRGPQLEAQFVAIAGDEPGAIPKLGIGRIGHKEFRTHRRHRSDIERYFGLNSHFGSDVERKAHF